VASIGDPDPQRARSPNVDIYGAKPRPRLDMLALGKFAMSCFAGVGSLDFDTGNCGLGTGGVRNARWSILRGAEGCNPICGLLWLGHYGTAVGGGLATGQILNAVEKPQRQAVAGSG